MAKSISSNGLFLQKAKLKRPGVHSKNRTSKLKSSKHYVKPYRGQGR